MSSQRAGLPTDASPGLAVRTLSVRYGGEFALRDLDLDVPVGSVTAVLGPSGSGKSTLLRAVAGLEAPAGGSIAYAGRDLARVPTHKRGFALMFQDGQLFSHQTVGRNVGYPLRLRHLPRRHDEERPAALRHRRHRAGPPPHRVRGKSYGSGVGKVRDDGTGMAHAAARRPRRHPAMERCPAGDRQMRSDVRFDVFAPLAHAIALARIATAQRRPGIPLVEVLEDVESLEEPVPVIFEHGHLAVRIEREMLRRVLLEMDEIQLVQLCFDALFPE